MSRDELIKQLNDAFTSSLEDDYEHSTVVSAAAGEKDVLRLLTNYDNSSEKNLYQNHPDVHMVERLVKEMSASGQSDIEIVGRELIMKFNQAVNNNDESRIAKIVAECKRLYMHLQGMGINSPERAVFYIVVIDTIKNL